MNIKNEKETGNKNKEQVQHKLSTEYIVSFITKLKLLVKSGMTPYNAIEIIKNQGNNREIKAILNKISKDCLDGCMTFGEALAVTNVFPSYMCSMIQLSEQTGHLEDVLASLRVYYSRQIRLRNSIRQLIVTPIILLITMICVISIILIKVMPIFDKAFIRLGIPMGLLGNTLLSLGKQLVNMKYIFLVIGVGILVIALTFLLVDKFRVFCRHKLIRLVKNTELYNMIASSKFAYSMSLTLNSGMRLDDALDKMEEIISEDRDLIDRLTKCKNESLSSGEESLIEGLFNYNIISLQDAQLLNIAQQTGNLAEMFEEIAQGKEREYINKINKIIGTVEPLIIFISAIATGIVIAGLLLPLMNVINTL